MKIVVAPDSFKGSLKSIEVIKCIKKSALDVFPDAEIVEVPIADGGDGMVEAMVHATHGRLIQTKAMDPLGRMVDCIYGEAAGAAVIGMSEVNGLALLKEEERSAMLASSCGTGELIRQALDIGFKDILIGIGGSATNDGGAGALQALGMKFFRRDGNEITRMCGKELEEVARIDASRLDTRLKTANVTIMCDVTNPMIGVNGATRVYGHQKGADARDLDKLENGMAHFASLLDTYAGKKVSRMSGSGAAGGIGAALATFAGAKLESGINAVLERVSFSNLLLGADLVITGEGRVDNQSAFGKVIHGITRYANELEVPVIAIVGSIGQGVKAVYDIGVKAIVPIPDKPMLLKDCIQEAERLVAEAAYRVFSLIEIGCEMEKHSLESKGS